MNADLSRLPSGVSGWVDLIEHVLTLGDLSEVDYLELKGRLAFDSSPARKRSAVTLSRTIVGMANRMPDVADRHLGGFGVVLVGVENDVVVGVAEVDPAELRQSVESYVGKDGPRWDHQFVQHRDGLVLAVLVDPPEWGDRIHSLRKDFSDSTSKLSVRDGDVPVRVPGATRLASSADLVELETRLSRAPHTGAEVRAGFKGVFERVSRESVRGLIQDEIAAAADELLSKLPRPKHKSPVGASQDLQAMIAQTAIPPDQRTPEEFREAVEAWVRDSQSGVEIVTEEFLRHQLRQGCLVLRNISDRYLEGVRVRVRISNDLKILTASDATYRDHGGPFEMLQLLAERPAAYGSLKPHGLRSSFGALVTPNLPRLPVTTNVEVQRTSTEWVISWMVGDLPPQQTAMSRETLAVFHDESSLDELAAETAETHTPLSSHVRARWSMTARGIDHVFKGEFTLICDQGPGTVRTWSRSSGE